MVFFQNNFSDVVVHHIPHKYSEEMSQKSIVVSLNYYYFMCILYMKVPLGVQLKSEMKYEGMIDIMTELHKYVPVEQFDRKVMVNIQ